MSYQMLLVDDEVHAIEGVKSDLDLKKLGITGLFTAYNIRQAKEVLNKEPIDIMVCDIEMPQGSGLELLAWVREHYPNTATIFLTSHADFQYAKEALRLGSLDYLLKPVLAGDLENSIRQAQSVIDRNNEVKRFSQSHQLWLKHHSLIIEYFWLDLINHSIPSRSTAIREQVKRHYIPIEDHSVFLPILISVQRWNKSLSRRDEKILEYALKNSAEEMIVSRHGNGICFPLERGILLVILVANGGHLWDTVDFMNVCTQYTEFCNHYFYCDLSCYIGQSVPAEGMADLVAKLRFRTYRNVAFFNQVYLYDEFDEDEHTDHRLPELSKVASLLKTGAREAVIRETEKLLGELVHNREMDADVLHQFNQNFMQVLYSFLNLRGIQANQLFGDEVSRNLSDAAGRTVTDMLAWIRHAVCKAMTQAEAVRKTDSVVQSVRQYISLNMDQDLSRETIAKQVFLHPDYLSRIFKKETGYSISEYVLQERMRLAKELLSQSNIPVSSIASSVGYNNFSHFAKMFRKQVGMGPTEYRERMVREIDSCDSHSQLL